MGLRYKRERIMIKKYGNVRKCTRKNSGSQPHIKVYRDGVKTSKETVDLTVYCRKLVCNPLKLHGKISLLFITQNDII